MFYAVGSILSIVETFFWAAIRKWLNNLVLGFWIEGTLSVLDLSPIVINL
jgi:hypothetical protein